MWFAGGYLRRLPEQSRVYTDAFGAAFRIMASVYDILVPTWVLAHIFHGFAVRCLAEPHEGALWRF